MPQPQPPSPSPPNRGSLFSLSLASVALVLCIGGLSILTLGFAPLIVLTVLGIGGLIAFNYLVWGWWLGDVIRREAEGEEGDESSIES